MTISKLYKKCASIQTYCIDIVVVCHGLAINVGSIVRCGQLLGSEIGDYKRSPDGPARFEISPLIPFPQTNNPSPLPVAVFTVVS